MRHVKSKGPSRWLLLLTTLSLGFAILKALDLFAWARLNMAMCYLVKAVPLML